MYPLNQCFASIFYIEQGWNITFTEKLSHKYRKQTSKNLKLILILTAKPKSRTCKRKVISAKPLIRLHTMRLLWGTLECVCASQLDPTTSASLSTQLCCTAIVLLKLCGSLRNIIPRVCKEFFSIYVICERHMK